MRAVIAYAVGLSGLLAVKILAPGFYARQDIRTPVRIAIVVLIITQILNLAFVPWLGHAGLALSIGLAACCNALALLVGLLRAKIYRPNAGWLAFFLRLTLAVLAMAVVLAVVNSHIDWLALQARPGLRAALLLAVVGGGGLVYATVLVLAGFRPRHFKRQV